MGSQDGCLAGGSHCEVKKQPIGAALEIWQTFYDSKRQVVGMANFQRSHQIRIGELDGELFLPVAKENPYGHIEKRRKLQVSRKA